MGIYDIEVKAEDVLVGDLITYRQATLAGSRRVEVAVVSVNTYRTAPDATADDTVEVILANQDGFDWPLGTPVSVGRQE